jgi:hypothetical protein
MKRKLIVSCVIALAAVSGAEQARAEVGPRGRSTRGGATPHAGKPHLHVAGGLSHILLPAVTKALPVLKTASPSDFGFLKPASHLLHRQSLSGELLTPALKTRKKASIQPAVDTGADVMLDTSLVTATSPQAVDGVFTIPSTLGKQTGGNLFFSFSKFNPSTTVTAGTTTTETVMFTTAANVSRIFVRVTGGPSTIDGNVVVNSAITNLATGATTPAVDFFFTNSKGITLTPNATFNSAAGLAPMPGAGATSLFTGSLFLTTANAIKFSDGTSFGETGQAPLTTMAPSAFSFTGTPAAINVTGLNPELNPGIPNSASPLIKLGQGAVSLVGGNITMVDATLSATTGSLNIVSVASAGDVAVSGVTGISPIVVTAPSTMTLGTIDISSTFPLDFESAAGPEITLNADPSTASIPSIFIQGQSIKLTNVQLNLDGNPGGQVTIKGGSLTITDSLISAQTVSGGAAGSVGGGVNISLTGTFNLVSTVPSNHQGIDTVTQFAGTAGNITIDAPGGIMIDGFTQILPPGSADFGPFTFANSTGLFAGVLGLPDTTRLGGTVSLSTLSHTGGSAGTITLKNGAVVEGGDAMINGGDLSLTDSLIFATNQAGGPNGSGVNVNLTGMFSLMGTTQGQQTGISTCTFASLLRLGAAPITITATQGISITGPGNAMGATPSPENSTGLAADTLSSGNGGLITLASPSGKIVLDNCRIGVTSTGTGNAGTLIMSAQDVTLQNGALVQAGTASTGNAGMVSINGATLEITSGSHINLNATPITAFDLVNGQVMMTPTGNGNVGDSGNAMVDMTGNITLDGSSITSMNQNSGNMPGAITLMTPGSLTLQNGTVVSTELSGTGIAGSVSISGNTLNITGGSRIVSQSNPMAMGNGGDISINEKTITIDGAGQATGQQTGIFSSALGLSGKPGDIMISTNSLSVANSGAINNSTMTSHSGSIMIAAGTVTLSTSGNITSNALAGATGTGGEIDIGAASSPLSTLSLSSGAQISSASAGAAGGGSVNIYADSFTVDGGGITLPPTGVFTSTSTATTGNGGNIVANLGSGTLTLQNAGVLSAQTLGSGNGGTIMITGGDVNLTGLGKTTLTDVLQVNSTGPMSTGGSIILNVGSLDASAGAQINATSSGVGGSINITAQKGITLTSGAQLTTQAGTTGGSIMLTAATVDIDQGAIINARSNGIQAASQEAGGNLTISASQAITLATGGQLTTEAAGAANGGTIMIGSDGTIHMTDASIRTKGGTDGGNIYIDHPAGSQSPTRLVSRSVPSGITANSNQVVILENMVLNANGALGSGGNIFITPQSQALAIDSSSIITATGATHNGDIILSPDQDVAKKAVVLPGSLLSIGASVQPACPNVLQGFSTFTVAGGGATPMEPGGWIPSLEFSDLGAGSLPTNPKTFSLLEDQRDKAQETPLFQGDAWFANLPQAGTFRGIGDPRNSGR